MKHKHIAFYQGMVAEVSKLVEKKHGKLGKKQGSIARLLVCRPPLLTTMS